ncbi:hypothetical protein AB1Y20_017595 [Prymnesium parvum]|uniref:Histone-lysine N-methyltransferase n=1 Tax=Prymnesium parvum TaxID=97485 RepID=A0AB34JN26_PRYPA
MEREAREALQVGSVLEALDEDGLWFPARVIEATRHKVRVAYDGWDSDYDQWHLRRSKTLREHQGWGTMRKPNDWQTGAYCFALDFMGKWCPARVLHVSEDSVKVHYQKWPKKWDAWLVRSRLRRMTKDGVAPKEADDESDDVCALCETVGSLVCCDGICKRSFHKACVPPTNPAPEESDEKQRWLCSDCKWKRFRCFVCKKWGTARVDVHACSKKTCGMHYHLECLQASLHQFGGKLPERCKRVGRAPVGGAAASAIASKRQRAAEDGVPVHSKGVGDTPEEDVFPAAEDDPDGDCAVECDENTYESAGTVDAHAERHSGDEQQLEEHLSSGATSAHSSECSQEVDQLVAAGRDGIPEEDCALEPEKRLADDTLADAPDGQKACTQRLQDRKRAKPLWTWTDVICARHYCAECKQKESPVYGYAMTHCIRCTTAYHWKCAEFLSVDGLTQRSFVCNKCSESMPAGLNAPDHITTSLLTTEATVTHAVRTTLKKWDHLVRKRQADFDVPDDLKEELSNGSVLPKDDFAPPPYSVIRRSVYMHSEPREALPAIDSEMCSCASTTGVCDEACHNRSLQQECTSTNCSVGAGMCKNRPLAQLHASGALPLQVIKTERKGWGVKATRDIACGDLVVEYVGEVIDRATWEERKASLGRFDHMYFMALNQNEIVDASHRGNIARFINHSCSPNLVVQKWYINRVPRLLLFAKFDINAGDELSYNYAMKWFGNPDFAQRCYCLSKKCTGFMGPPPRSSNGGPDPKSTRQR